jgi:glycosyltransferase involved in cell wall biosynthesis
MTQHDALIIPSHSEGLPMTALEAMSLRLPVIATAVGALPELLGDSRGKLIPRPTTDAIVSAVEECRSDYGAAEKAADRAYDFVRRHYSPRTLISRLQPLIDTMIPGPAEQLTGPQV